VYFCEINGSRLTNVFIRHHLSHGGMTRLEAGKTVDSWVWLPPDVQSWHVGFTCRRAESWWRVFADRHSRVLSRFPGFLLQRMLPPSVGFGESEVWSDAIAVPETIRSVHEPQESHNKPDSPNPAIAPRFHVGSHWRGVGDPERSLIRDD
jgi:hypothetical protein